MMIDKDILRELRLKIKSQKNTAMIDAVLIDGLQRQLAQQESELLQYEIITAGYLEGE